MNLYRHGDLAITQIEKLPKNLKEIKNNILAYGEATGHGHILIAEPEITFRVLEDKRGEKYLDIRKPTQLTHQEHKTITIERGFYFISHEKEYDYTAEELKRVKD